MPEGMKESSFEIRGVSSGSSGQERKRSSISDQELYGLSTAQRNLFLVNLVLPVYRVSGRRIESRRFLSFLEHRAAPSVLVTSTFVFPFSRERDGADL